MLEKVNAGLFGNRKAIIEYNLTKYRLTSEVFGIVTWEMDIANDIPVSPASAVSWTQDFRCSLGFDETNEFPDILRSWSERIHPTDREKTLNAISAHLYDLTGETPLNTEYQLMLSNGDYRLFHACGTTLRNKKGEPVSITVAQNDITEKQQLEMIIEKNKDRLEKKQEIFAELNNLGASLLAVNKETLNKALVRSLTLIGRFTQADRVQIWRNEMIIDNMHFSLAYEWLSELGERLVSGPACHTFPYDEVPGWEDKLKRGKHINGPIVDMLPHEGVFFNRFNVRSLVVIPLFTNDGYWGFLRVDDCHARRSFSEAEMIDLKLYGQLLTFVIILSEKLDEINIERDNNKESAHWYKSILDAIPNPVSVTDTDMAWTFINTALENMIGKKRETLYGKPCKTMDTEICDTNDCGIACAKRYVGHTHFNKAGKQYRVDVSTLKKLNGNTSGFVEVIQEVQL